MATLTETAFKTRKIVKFGVVGILAFFVLRLGIGIGGAIWKKINPPPPSPPTVSFGKIPKIEFPSKDKPNNLTFKLETGSGQLPSLPDKMNVYFMPYQRPNLLALEKAKQEALKMGFAGEPEAVDEQTYRWTKKQEATKTLEMNIVNGSFTISYDWQNDPTILLEKKLPGEQQAKVDAQNFLRTLGALNDDLLMGKQEVSYLKAKANQFVSAISLSEADFVKVEIFRKNVDNWPVLTEDPTRGVISFIFSGSTNQDKKIIKVNFNYFPINYTSSGTYPLQVSDTYWQQLNKKEAFIANWNGQTDSIIIRRIYLAYFDSFDPQNFFQPIVVFEGDNNFFAYLPAISPEWFQQ